MATTATLSSATSNTTGTSVQIAGGQGAWLEIPNDSVFDGSAVTVRASTANTSGKFSQIGNIATIRSAGWLRLDLPDGAYVHALLEKAGAATNITANIVDQS